MFFFSVCGPSNAHAQSPIFRHAFSFWSILIVSTTCMRTAKALARLRLCAGSPELLLVANMLSILFSCAGSFFLNDYLLLSLPVITTSTLSALLITITSDQQRKERAKLFNSVRPDQRVAIRAFSIGCCKLLNTIVMWSDALYQVERLRQDHWITRNASFESVIPRYENIQETWYSWSDQATVVILYLLCTLKCYPIKSILDTSLAA